MVSKAAHLPTTSSHQRHPCRASIYCPLILPQLWFFQWFTYLPSLSGLLWFVVFCFAFHCLNKKLKWHLSHSFTKTWLSYPISTLLLLDYRLHFGRINRLVSTWVCNPARPCDSSPILLFISERLVDPEERGPGCFVQAPLCLSQPPHRQPLPPLFYCSLESETWAEPALAGWQFLLICDRFLDK